MHVLIINGSPRVKEYSNTDKILARFTKDLQKTERHLSSTRSRTGSSGIPSGMLFIKILTSL